MKFNREKASAEGIAGSYRPLGFTPRSVIDRLGALNPDYQAPAQVGPATKPNYVGNPRLPGGSNPLGGSSGPPGSASGAVSGPTFRTGNGTRTLDQMKAVLVNLGWDGQGEVPAAYARTTKQPVYMTGAAIGAQG
mgnify:CR=1 FL=1